MACNEQQDETMGACIDCGKPAGWARNPHLDCKQRHDDLMARQAKRAGELEACRDRAVTAMTEYGGSDSDMGVLNKQLNAIAAGDKLNDAERKAHFFKGKQLTRGKSYANQSKEASRRSDG